MPTTDTPTNPYVGPRTFTERVSLNGSYLTVDLRYYFHEDPDRAKLRRQRNKKG